MIQQRFWGGLGFRVREVEQM